MTEKRFKLSEPNGAYLIDGDKPFGHWLNDDDKIVDLLNEQNETIQRLQAQLSHMEYRFFEYRDKIKSLPKDEVGEVLQKYYNQELGLFTHDTLEKIAKELGIDLK